MKTLYTFAITLLIGFAFMQPVTAQTYPANPKATVQDSAAVKEGSQRKKKKGKKPEAKKQTRVTLAREVVRTSMSKRGEGTPNKIEITIRQAGRPINSPQDIQMVGSNGTTVSSENYQGFENIELPFEGIVNFKAQNQMGTVTIDREVRFVVTDPGQWVLRIEL